MNIMVKYPITDDGKANFINRVREFKTELLVAGVKNINSNVNVKRDVFGQILDYYRPDNNLNAM